MSRWEKMYKGLSDGDRTKVNDLVNGIFREETGFQGKIVAATPPAIKAKWLEIRDEVLANRRLDPRRQGHSARANHRFQRRFGTHSRCNGEDGNLADRGAGVNGRKNGNAEVYINVCCECGTLSYAKRRNRYKAKSLRDRCKRYFLRRINFSL